MSFKFAVAVAAMFAGAVPAYAAGQVNLVTNGDFELLAGGAGNGSQISPTLGTSNLTGWTMGARANSASTPGLGFIYQSGLGDSTTATQSGIYVYGPANGNNNGLTANSGANTSGGTSGGNYIALDADPLVNGSLSQTVSGLTVGQDYILSFYWATAELTDTNTGPTTETVQASFGSQVRTTATQSTVQKGFDAWQQTSIYFNAQSASQTLSFLAVGTPSGLPPTVLLDAVSLVAAPEPSTWAIMLVGVAGLAGFTVMRRRSNGASGVAA